MDDVKHTERKPHSLEYRTGVLRVSGVKEVKNFDDREIVLVLDSQKLTIRGSELSVTELKTSDGNFTVGGKVISLTYSRGGGESFIKKLFK